MARKAREKSSTGDYAVVLKCVEEIFKNKKVKNMFIEYAQQYLGEGLKGIRVSNFQAEMLIHESEKGISMDMKPLMTSFARAYNREFENEGKIFADRFKSSPVETPEDFQSCIKYLENGKTASVFSGEKKKATTEKAVKKTVKKETEKKPVKKETKPAKPTKKVVKAEEKPVVKQPIQEEKKEEKPKPKKNDLPVWLL